jgi:hypothetical protein
MLKYTDTVKVGDTQYTSSVRVGDTIRILSLRPEANSKYVGKEGVVKSVDDTGTIQGTWGDISLIHGLDFYAIIKRAPLKEGEFAKLDYFEKMAFGIPDELFYEGRADRPGRHNFDDFIHTLNGR